MTNLNGRKEKKIFCLLSALEKKNLLEGSRLAPGLIRNYYYYYYEGHHIQHNHWHQVTFNV